MNAKDWIEVLSLRPHPEGGYFRETYRSAETIARDHLPSRFGGDRAFSTAIYFLLRSGDFSALHRIRQDEVWHFYEGAPLELLELSPDLSRLRTHHLGPLDDSRMPVHVIPAGHWQAARSTGSYTLVGCTVGPGFEFADFTMLSDEPEAAAAVTRAFPAVAPWI